MEELKSYKELTNRGCDFIVRYSFYLKEEVGYGRTMLPYQHLRCDFGYAEEVDTYSVSKNNLRLFMIHPEFLNERGTPILEKDKSVNKAGTATMWILDPNWAEYHKRRIEIGTKGYFMEGGTKVAECEVIEIVGLTNY